MDDKNYKKLIGYKAKIGILLNDLSISGGCGVGCWVEINQRSIDGAEREICNLIEEILNEK